MTHPWYKSRPLSAWIPAGLSATHKIGDRKERPVVDDAACSMCGLCWIYCPEGIISRDTHIRINYEYCRGCGICVEECPKHAISFEDEH